MTTGNHVLLELLNRIATTAESFHDPELHEDTLDGRMSFCEGCHIGHLVRLAKKEVTKHGER